MGEDQESDLEPNQDLVARLNELTKQIAEVIYQWVYRSIAEGQPMDSTILNRLIGRQSLDPESIWAIYKELDLINEERSINT